MNPSNPWLSPLSPEQIEIATGIQRELNDSVPYQRDLDNFEGQDGSSRPQFSSQNAVYSRQNPTSGLIQSNPQQLSSSYTITNSGSHNQSIATSLNQMSPGSSSKSSKIFENSPSTSQSIHNSPIEYTTPGSIPQEEQNSDCEDDENLHTDKLEEDQDTTIKDPVHYCMTECRYQLYQTIMIDYLEDFKAWINVNRSMSEVHSFTAYLARDHQQLLSEITDMDRERYQYIISANEIITEFAKNALIKELNAPLPQNKQYWEGKLGMLQVLSSSTAVSQRTEIKDLLEEHTDLLINQTEKIQDLMDSIQERDEIIKNLVTQFDGLKSQFQSLMIKADKESRSKSMSPFTLGQASAPLSYQTPIKPALSVRSDCSSVSLHKGKQPLQSPETPTITVEQLNKLRDIIINDPNANVKYTALIRLGFSSEMAGNFADNWDHFSVKLCNKLNEITSPDELKPWILDLHQKFERAKYLQQ